VDATAVTGVRVDFRAMARFSRERRQSRFAGNVRTASLAGSNAVFAFGRVYQTLLNHPQITVQVFRDREEALAWLGVGPEDLPGGGS
jgi:hypothetical protein